MGRAAGLPARKRLPQPHVELKGFHCGMDVPPITQLVRTARVAFHHRVVFEAVIRLSVGYLPRKANQR